MIKKPKKLKMTKEAKEQLVSRRAISAESYELAAIRADKLARILRSKANSIVDGDHGLTLLLAHRQIESWNALANALQAARRDHYDALLASSIEEPPILAG